MLASLREPRDIHSVDLVVSVARSPSEDAELVSKVLLLAEDHKIKDPTILEQLRD